MTAMINYTRDEELIAKLESRKKINWLLRRINVFGRVFYVINLAEFGQSMLRPYFSSHRIR